MTPGPTQPRADRSRGFTLLELVLVMVLLTATLAVAMPSLRGFVAGSKERDAIAQVVSLAQYAKARSAADAKAYRLNLDAGTYYLTVEESGSFARMQDDYGRTFDLPAGMRIESVPTPRAGTDPRVRPPTANGITFYPEGRADAALFRLTDAAGRVTLLGCPSPSESFRVLSAEEAADL
jgi:prepilin-type N-terminal cleavage/methylation domain-containing protein